MSRELRRIVVFGNSGSGKSTLAKKLVAAFDVPHLDLDTVAWASGDPPTRAAVDDSTTAIRAFTDATDGWVVEGCYADLLPAALGAATHAVFLDPGIDGCLANCRARPFEPHKYATPEEQDARLAMLEDWVRQYEVRDDEYGRAAHERLFDAFAGAKRRVASNDDDTVPWVASVL